jgi:hypothetical protein
MVSENQNILMENEPRDTRIVFKSKECFGLKLDNRFVCYKKVHDNIEPLLSRIGYFADTPFHWVRINHLYDTENDFSPVYNRIDEKYKCLPVTIKIDALAFVAADRKNPDLLVTFFEISTLECLIHIGQKYSINTDVLEEKRRLLGEIPQWDKIV